jgi:hypothetical protein
VLAVEPARNCQTGDSRADYSDSFSHCGSTFDSKC